MLIVFARWRKTSKWSAAARTSTPTPMQSHSRSALKRVLVALMTAGYFVWLLSAADNPSAVPTAGSLDGVWVRVGEPGHVVPAPKSGGQLKFRMNQHWTFTQADPATGEVMQHFGGTYRLQGNDYTETIDYSTDPDDPELRKTLKFTVTIEGDTMTQIGVGNSYNEVWQRVR
jgi:hypothetical protein